MNLVERIVSVQQEKAREIADMKELQTEIKEQLAVNSSVLREESRMITGTSKSCECQAAEQSKQALVSALVSEFVSFHTAHI